MKRKATHDWWPTPPAIEEPLTAASPLGRSWSVPTPQDVHRLAIELAHQKFSDQEWDDLGSGWQHQFLDEARAGLNPLPAGDYTQHQLDYFSAKRPLSIRTQRVIEAAQRHQWSEAQLGKKWGDLEVEEQLAYFKFAEGTLASGDNRRAQGLAHEEASVPWFDLTQAERDKYLKDARELQDLGWDPGPYYRWRGAHK